MDIVRLQDGNGGAWAYCLPTTTGSVHSYIEQAKAIELGHGDKDDSWQFNNIDTLTVAFPDAPRPTEIVVVVALSDGGRPSPRVHKNM